MALQVHFYEAKDASTERSHFSLEIITDGDDRQKATQATGLLVEMKTFQLGHCVSVGIATNYRNNRETIRCSKHKN